MAGLLGTLTLACAVVGLLTYAHLHSVLVGQLDSQLTAANQRYAACMTHPPDGGGPAGDPDGDGPGGLSAGPAACAQQQQQGAFSAQAAYTTASYPSQTGKVTKPYLAANNHSCELSASDRAELAGLPVNGTPRTVTLTDYGQYRLVSAASDGEIYVTGLPLSNVNETLRQVALAEIAVFSLAVVVTGLIGTAWVRVSLRPLRRVAATATRVTELPLASGEVVFPDRVPDANPATEVGQLGSAFNRMLGHVESALARRAASEDRLRRFAADASHELRTPLAAIRGYAELARRHPGPVPPDIAHALSRVESESARMSVLVDELLLLAQLDAGRPWPARRST